MAMVVWTSHLFVLVSASTCCWNWVEKLYMLLLCSFFLTVLYYFCQNAWIGRRAGTDVLRLESSQIHASLKKTLLLLALQIRNDRLLRLTEFIFMSRNWLQEVRRILVNLTWVLDCYRDLLQPSQGSVNTAWCRLPFSTQFWVLKMFPSFAPLLVLWHL